MNTSHARATIPHNRRGTNLEDHGTACRLISEMANNGIVNVARPDKEG